MVSVLFRVWKCKTLLVMRLTLLICLFFTLQSIAIEALSQNQRLSINQKNIKIEEIIQLIENKTDYYFMYSAKTIDVERNVDIEATDKLIPEILNDIFKGTNVSYKINGRLIALSKNGEESTVRQQPHSVSGKVVDSSGAPLPGVSVVIKGTTNGVITDSDGKFSLTKVPEDAAIQFSFVGMKKVEEAVKGKSVINVTLTEETIGIGEVVAVGYGIQKKVNLSGAVTSIKSDEIAKRQVGQASMALQGIAPGVTVTQRTGQPGVDEGNIRIRGIGTLNDANPLVLVDGIEMSMNSLDVASIESISVLKDASSSSIYGSRAANGVILITTKRAKEGQFTLSYSSFLGVQMPTNLPKKVNAVDHMTLLNEAYTNVGRTSLYSDDYINSYNANHSANPDLYPDVDWQKEILNGDGIQTNHFLSVSGGTKRLKIFGALGYLSQNGLVKPVTYQRYFCRVNTDIEISPKISASIDMFIYDHRRNSVAQYNSVSSNGSGIGLIWGMMNKLPAIQAVKYSNGLWAEGQNGENPVAILKVENPVKLST